MTTSLKVLRPLELSNAADLAQHGDGEVLFASDSWQTFSVCRRKLERKGYRCHFASSIQTLEELLKQKQFDIVLTTSRIQGRSTHWLGTALSGTDASLFFMLPVEIGCWWVPVLKRGQDCFGSSALRPREFLHFLDDILEDAKPATANGTR